MFSWKKGFSLNVCRVQKRKGGEGDGELESFLRESELGTHEDDVELSDVLLVASSDDGHILEVGEGLLVAGSGEEERDCMHEEGGASTFEIQPFGQKDDLR